MQMNRNERETVARFFYQDPPNLKYDLEVSEDNFIQTGLLAALRAGSILQKSRENIKAIDVKRKPDDSKQTNVDVKAEEVAKEVILSAFPDHLVIGEETGGTVDPSKYCWVIDPMDSTNAYLSHENTSAVSIALIKDNQVVLGITYNPFTGEFYYAFGENKSRLIRHYGFSNRVFADDLPLQQIDTGNFVNIHPGKANIEIVRQLTKGLATSVIGVIDKILQTGGSPALEVASVAKGHFSFVHNWNPKTPTLAWDLMAGIHILENAGGKVTDINGNRIKDVGHHGIFVASINEEFHRQILTLLQL